MPPASTHSPAVAHAVLDRGGHRRAHGALIQLPVRLCQVGLAHRDLGRGRRDLVVARRQPGGGEIGLHGRDTRPAPRRPPSAPGRAAPRRRNRAGRGWPAAPGPARHRSASPWPRRGSPRAGRSPPAACRASGRRAPSGRRASCASASATAARCGRPPARNSRAPGLDLVAALDRHALAASRRPEPPAGHTRPRHSRAASRRRRHRSRQGQEDATGDEQPVHAARPRSRLSTWASSTRAGSNGSASCGANTARQTAIISTGATTRRATASLSCGRNSPASTPRRVQPGDQGQGPVDHGRLVEPGELGKLVQLADQQAREHHEPAIADDRGQHRCRAAQQGCHRPRMARQPPPRRDRGWARSACAPAPRTPPPCSGSRDRACPWPRRPARRCPPSARQRSPSRRTPRGLRRAARPGGYPCGGGEACS